MVVVEYPIKSYKNYYGVISTDNNLLAGIWVFYIKYGFGKRKGILKSEYTYVDRRYRKRGVAKKMWGIGLDKYKPVAVDVTAVSDKGYTLIESLSKKYNKIIWIKDEEGLRKLRDLR